MKIDVHNHIIPPAVLDLLSRDSAYGVTFPASFMHMADGFRFPLTESFYDTKAKMAELTAHDLDGAVLSIAPPAFLYASTAAAGKRCVPRPMRDSQSLRRPRLNAFAGWRMFLCNGWR